MIEILLLEIYKNIAINSHGTWCFSCLLLSCSPYLVFLHFCIFFRLWYLLQLCFQLHFTGMMMRWVSLSCLELCKSLSWAAFVSLE